MEKKYFNLQLKSAFRVYPAILLVTMITIFSIVFTSAFIFYSNKKNDEKQRIALGVVGNLEHTYLEIGLDALKNMQSSRFFITVHEMESEQEAIKALEKRELSGYVFIPDGFVESIFRGSNIPAKYVTLNAPEGFGTIISAEIAKTISKIVVESQNGMYSMQYLADDYNDENIDPKIDRLMGLYVESILNRIKVYEMTTLGTENTLSVPGYYICGILVLLMLLWGISCNRVFSSRNIDYAKMLNISGMNPKKQVFCEYLSYLVISGCTLLLFALIAGITLQFVDIDIPELIGTGAIDCVFFILKLLPVIIMITVMHTAVYEFIQNTIATVLMQFILSIVLGYISGCFYPTHFFPDALQTIAEILPVGAGFSYVRKVMSNVVPVWEFCVIALYTAFFFFLTVCMRKYKISGDIR